MTFPDDIVPDEAPDDMDEAAVDSELLNQEPAYRPAVIAIVGRPNVGKSTLFNRLSGKHIAIVNDTPGVTRDRREMGARLRGVPVTYMDTAGFENDFC